MPANPIDFASGVPLYRQLVEELRRRFAEGDFAPGAPMPSESALEHEYGLGRNTVRRVLYQLRDEGYVKPRRGERWQAADPLPSERGREVVQLPPETSRSDDSDALVQLACGAYGRMHGCNIERCT